ncbi:hypothetical protein [Actinoplanes ianthinogenes]|nr:hypothetical protein [Actinoplanes ianthinogenes]
MDITTRTQAPTTALDKAATSMKAFTVLSSTALAGLAAVAIHGHSVNTFMWVRGALLPIVAVLLYRMTRGGEKALDRLRTLTVIMPIAVIGIDLIPGVCPFWYAAVQTVCMIPVIVAAIQLRTR